MIAEQNNSFTKIGMATANEKLYKDYLDKAKRFCAYTERCTLETTTRLKQLGVPHSWIEPMIDELSNSGYIDDARFASIFARSKFNQNQWGKVKIANALTARNIAPEFISNALNELEEERYVATLEQLIEKKLKSSKELSDYQLKGKIIEYCLQKGYEYDLCLKLTNKIQTTL